MAIAGSKSSRTISAKLIDWYERAHRDLPWRRTRDPYCIWVSEIMLQQTRVEAVIPYYERFLQRFPSVAALASAPEHDLLTCWSGLGYYSRVRNMQKAARLIVDRGAFPSTYEDIRELPGIGDYTAAAIASIAFHLPHAVLDGNAIRVLARLTNDRGDVKSSTTRRRLQDAANGWLDRERAGDFNQSMMELGATICTPRAPACLICPVCEPCAARRLGVQAELPVKKLPSIRKRIEKTVYVVERSGKLLMWQRPQHSTHMSGFWELPDEITLANAMPGESIGHFRHTITNHDYLVTVRKASIKGAVTAHHWWSWKDLEKIPLSTAAKKALLCLKHQGGG